MILIKLFVRDSIYAKKYLPNLLVETQMLDFLGLIHAKSHYIYHFENFCYLRVIANKIRMIFSYLNFHSHFFKSFCFCLNNILLIYISFISFIFFIFFFNIFFFKNKKNQKKWIIVDGMRLIFKMFYKQFFNTNSW